MPIGLSPVGLSPVSPGEIAAALRPPPQDAPLPPEPWAGIALRASLGFAGTVLTTLCLWSLAPPPL
jgi:hypothetical protein